MNMRDFKLAVAWLAGSFFMIHNLLELWHNVGPIVKAALR